jgi:hypothetical protein
MWVTEGNDDPIARPREVKASEPFDCRPAYPMILIID